MCRQKRPLCLPKVTIAYLTRRKHNVKATLKECHRVIKFYDKDLDGRLIFKEFLLLILPLDNSNIRHYAASKEIYHTTDNRILSYAIEDLLLQIMTKEIECVRKIETEIQNLQTFYDYNTQSAFKAIEGGKCLTFDSIKNLSLIHICRCRRLLTCRSRWSPYH
eukprot:TRINITY_DN10075_c0_g1_i2.p1 TRINITY_DN10075_c0_g1~~TRINITY_DN10075_c0_g1_i2.p1  ORF type:complete len:163 (-),score=6.19 TRINITY_DN10075_c0_g1_i2:35-523(-)